MRRGLRRSGFERAWRSASRAWTARRGCVAGRSVRWTRNVPSIRPQTGGEAFAERRQPRPVVVAVLLGASGDIAGAALRVEELDAAAEREALLDRIDDLDEVGVDAGPGDRLERALGLRQRVEEIADENDIGEAAERGEVGRGGGGAAEDRGDPFGGVRAWSGRWRRGGRRVRRRRREVGDGKQAGRSPGRAC